MGHCMAYWRSKHGRYLWFQFYTRIIPEFVLEINDKGISSYALGNKMWEIYVSNKWFGGRGRYHLKYLLDPSQTS